MASTGPPTAATRQLGQHAVNRCVAHIPESQCSNALPSWDAAASGQDVQAEGAAHGTHAAAGCPRLQARLNVLMRLAHLAPHAKPAVKFAPGVHYPSAGAVARDQRTWFDPAMRFAQGSTYPAAGAVERSMHSICNPSVGLAPGVEHPAAGAVGRPAHSVRAVAVAGHCGRAHGAAGRPLQRDHDVLAARRTSAAVAVDGLQRQAHGLANHQQRRAKALGRQRAPGGMQRYLESVALYLPCVLRRRVIISAVVRSVTMCSVTASPTTRRALSRCNAPRQSPRPPACTWQHCERESLSYAMYCFACGLLPPGQRGTIQSSGIQQTGDDTWY